MITEDYVSFETAKLLKENGFEGDTSCYYTKDNSKRWVYQHYHDFDKKDRIECPTIQMAMKWLREVHEIFIEIPIYSIAKPVLYRWNAFKNGRLVTDEEKPKTSNCIIKGDDNNPTVYYYKYEESCEAAIKYCLENLI